MSDLDPRRCPICKGPNDCDVAQGSGTCWCFSMGKPSDEVLEKIPYEALKNTCICRFCFKGEKSPSALTDELKKLSQKR